MSNKEAVIERHMEKFAQLLDDGNEISIYGLTSLEVSRDILMDREAAKEYIGERFYPMLFSELGNESALAMMQVLISSGDAMYDILELLWLASLENPPSPDEGKIPPFSQVIAEVLEFAKGLEDMQLASRFTRAAIDYYYNFKEANQEANIDDLLLNICNGMEGDIVPFMSDEMVEAYNHAIFGMEETHGIYELQSNEAFSFIPKDDADEDRKELMGFWGRLLLLGIGAWGISRLTKRKN
jgi:hypothetical protein